MGAHLHAWAGVSRQGFDAVGDDLAEALRAEALALDATADEIELASRRAEQAQSDRQEAHDAEQRRLERLAEEAAR
jgi:uncharacterized protein YukE